MVRSFITVLAVLSMTASIPAKAGVEGSFFAVIVSDIDASVAWYTTTLSLERASSSKTERFEIVNLRGPGLFVELIEIPNAKKRPEGRTHGPFKLGVLVDDLDGFLQSLPASYPRPDVVNDTANKLKLVQLRDPDGNIIQVMDFD